jgi:hypothetical protein
MAEWDRLLAQATLTLNLLRSLRIHPSLSAHASLFGNFDFNRTPMAPPGTRIVAHENSDNRTSYGEHGKVGWYIGPSLDHYRCYKCYFEDTMMERDVLTVEFFPQKIPFPTFTREAYLRQTAEDMLHLLQPDNTSPLLAPLAFGPPMLNAFAKVAAILGRATRPPPTPPVAPIPTPVVVTPPVETVIPDVIPATPPRVATPTPSPPPLRPSPPPLRPVLQDITNQSAPVTAPRVPTPKSKAPFDDVPHRTRSTTCLRASPRFKSLYSRLNDQRSARMHLAQSVQHDPSVAGKMYNPTTGKLETIDSLLNGPDAARWILSLTNEWGRCTRGLSKNRSAATIIIGQNTMVFLKPHEVPLGRKVTYANFVCTMRPDKSEVYRIRMTVGGDRLEAYQDVRSPAVGIIDTKLHLNSTISDADEGARCATCNIKDFFLGSKMKIFQYMKIHRKYVPQAIIDEYNLTDDHFDDRGFIFMEIQKGMYGLKEASVLAFEQRLVSKVDAAVLSPLVKICRLMPSWKPKNNIMEGTVVLRIRI